MIITLVATGCGDPSAHVVIPTTTADLRVAFTLDATGTGNGLIGDVSIDANVGTVSVGGAPLDALVYARGSVLDFEVYQSLVVGPDRWYVVWLYCRGEQLEQIWREGTDGTPLDGQLASGTCNRIWQPVDEAAELPAVDMVYPPLEPGYTFSGTALFYDGATPGTMTLDGVEMILLPFESYRCLGCGSGPGWYELHALFYDPVEQRGCFGVFYLYVDTPDEVALEYVICLPDLSTPTGNTTFAATWEKK